MPRGMHFYNPITQVPEFLPDESDLSRIEMYLSTITEKWEARRINEKGLIEAVLPGSRDRDAIQAQAEQMWPGLPIYEVENESTDSTWTGFGPSPRAWQPAAPSPPELHQPYQSQELIDELNALPNEEDLLESPDPEETFHVHGISVETAGQYILGADVVRWLNLLADQMADEKRAGPWDEAVRSAADLIEESLG